MSRETVLVTGGTGGIGRALVELLTMGGQQVAFTWQSRRREADEIAVETAGRAQPYELDLADRDRPGALVREIERDLGPLVGLVNNAGVQESGLVGMTSDEAWDRVLDLNLGGAFRFCRAVVPRLLHRRAGSIVNVSSLAARRGVRGLAAYAASKAGLEALTRCLAREVGGRGVRVNAVAPGWVSTEMTEDVSAQRRKDLRASECLPRGVTPAQVAAVVAFLLSDDSASITGQSVVVDAGSSA